MQCRNCGTEIADKAIVGFRWGQSTTDPLRKPVPIRPRGPGWTALAAPAITLLLSLLVLLSASATPIPIAMRAIGGLLAAAGALLLIVRLIRRR